MKAIVSFVGLCFSIAAAGLPCCAVSDSSATTHLVSGRHERKATVELRDDYGVRTPDAGFSSDGGATSIAAAMDGVGPAIEVSTESLPLVPSAVFGDLCAGPAPCDGSFSVAEGLPQPDSTPRELPATRGGKTREDSSNQLSDESLGDSTAHSSDGVVGNVELRQPADSNRDIYYKNKLEFSLDGGWLPINIPFPLDPLEGDPYHTYPLKYTLVPIITSLRWHMSDVRGPWILRGNWDLTFSGSATAIPRGPETRYFSYIMGIRRNFVPRNSRVGPYFDIRLGLGDIDAKGGPHGIKYAQGQDFTFTLNAGSGVRYNFNPRYAISAGLHYMHISNADLSGSKYNYGINVFGPMFGIDIQLRRHQRHSEQ